MECTSINCIVKDISIILSLFWGACSEMFPSVHFFNTITVLSSNTTTKSIYRAMQQNQLLFLGIVRVPGSTTHESKKCPIHCTHPHKSALNTTTQLPAPPLTMYVRLPLLSFRPFFSCLSFLSFLLYLIGYGMP